MRKQLYQRLVNGVTNMWEEINGDHEFLEMRKFHNDDFDIHYKEAYDQYLAGDWENAGAGFHELHRRKPEDGPTRVLNNYIGKHNRIKPDWWKGVRPLTSK